MLTLLVALAMNAVPEDRQSFGRQLEKLRRGMTAQEVRNLLGEPDDIWTESDSSLYCGIDESRWCYGSDGHLTMPTVGSVIFRDGQVFGWTPFGPSVTYTIAEPEMRKHLRFIYSPPRRDLVVGQFQFRYQVGTLRVEPRETERRKSGNAHNVVHLLPLRVTYCLTT